MGSIFVSVAGDAGCEKQSDGGDEIDYSRDEEQAIPVGFVLRTTAGCGSGEER